MTTDDNAARIQTLKQHRFNQENQELDTQYLIDSVMSCLLNYVEHTESDSGIKYEDIELSESSVQYISSGIGAMVESNPKLWEYILDNNDTDDIGYHILHTCLGSGTGLWCYALEAEDAVDTTILEYADKQAKKYLRALEHHYVGDDNLIYISGTEN